MGQPLEEKTVFRVELHVHTPSSNCYKGPKSDDEYLKIVEKASMKKIDILAITDHNSIKGYLKIQSLKQKIRAEYSALEGIRDSKEAKEKVKKLAQILSEFDSLLLLPGVEFEVNNGIHLLVLFNPDSPVTEIERFLSEGGYDENTFGKENDVFANWSIYDLYKECKKYDCVVIDAHSDSNKGIYNTLEGQPRIHAFSDPGLMGICYKSEKQRANIERIISQSPRKQPIALLKSSDSHHIDEIGKDTSFFRLGEKTWISFKAAFSNPEESIFTTYPQTQLILKKVASSGSCLFINQLDADSTMLLNRYICGLANADGGFVIIGADSISAINGLVDESPELIKKVIAGIYDSIPGLPTIRVNRYPIKDNTSVFVMKVPHSEDLIGINNDNQVYCYHNKKIEILNAPKIQALITHRLTAQYLDRISSELDNIRMKTTAIGTYIKSFPILNSFYNKSCFLSSVVEDYDLINPAHLTPQQFAILTNNYHKHENGVCRGNTFYIERTQKPRLAEAFLRITLPCFFLKGINIKKEGSVLFIVPGGAVYYSEKTPAFYSPGMPVLKVRIVKSYPIKFLCAFLKSSFFIWYVLNKFNTLDIFPPEVYNNARIPLLHLKNSNESAAILEVERLFDDIVAAEKAFLLKQNSINDTEALWDFTIKHNESLARAFWEMDEKIFALLNISKDEQTIILENLRVNGIFVPASK